MVGRTCFVGVGIAVATLIYKFDSAHWNISIICCMSCVTSSISISNSNSEQTS